ncbi:MAG: ATP-binding protein, partial [Oscillospiraceae bacterium]|nr:ATP-binding protein [Oscillospiraceae bacterium]
SEGLIIVNNQNRIQLINSAALAIFGVSTDITGENLNYLTYNNDMGHAVRECQSSDTNAIFELTLRGRVYFISIKRLSNSDLVMVTLTDVNEIKETSRRREEFFANASHELKTPLTSIKGFNELAQINNKDEKIEKYISGISRETDRMLSLIADMLKLSELEISTQTPSDTVTISLAEIVTEVITSLETTISEKNLSIDIIGDASVTAKPEHLYELIKNLIENAVRYNKQDGSISITMESERNKNWLFIHDTGIGISSDEQIRIFERFYRVEKSRSSRNGGTGLGLSIVKHICFIYNWDVTLKSTLGLGTEVTITFNG